MMVYQYNQDMLPDTDFHPGDLKFIVPGNEGRLLDYRRTPLRVLDIKHASGFFVVEILDFEDKGAVWELPLENVNRCQFAKGSALADNSEVARFTKIISHLDQPLKIAADPDQRATSLARITSLRNEIASWLAAKSAFLKSGASLDFSSQIGYQTLWGDLKKYMDEAGLLDIEEAFAKQFVSNPNSGELVKGHSIVLAELGLVSFEGKRVRDETLFEGLWSKKRREDHILHRLAFMQALFEHLGYSSVVLYRGSSFQGQPETRGKSSLISATFNLDVAMSHFNEQDRTRTGILLRQSVPIERVLMSFLETAEMNQHYQEAEAVLLTERANKVF